MTFHTRRATPAKGGLARGDRLGHEVSPRVSVLFDPAMFDRLAGEAARRQIPFAEVVREKVALGYRADAGAAR